MAPTAAIEPTEAPIPVGTWVRKRNSLPDQVIRDGQIGIVIRVEPPGCQSAKDAHYFIRWKTLVGESHAAHIRLEVVDEMTATLSLAQREVVM